MLLAVVVVLIDLAIMAETAGVLGLAVRADHKQCLQLMAPQKQVVAGAEVDMDRQEMVVGAY
jgi:hypothetical protein